MKNKLKKTIFNIAKQIILGLVIFAMVFPYSTLVALADPVPVEEKGWNREWNFRTSEYTNSMVELMGEIMGPIYQLATPGSNLTYDIYRYLMKHTEDELGIDKDFFRRMQKKVEAPTVDIIFAPTNPKVGEKVTAFAIPHGFKNSKEKLYYTWYIVHDNEDNVTEGRDEAMRIVAAGGYDRDLFGEPKGDDEDRDAYNVSAGGDDGVGKKSGTATKEDCEGCDCLDDITMFGGLSDRGCFDDRGELLYSSFEEYDEAFRNRDEESANIGRGAVNSSFISRCYRHNFGRQSQDGADYSGRDLIITCHHAFNENLGTDDGGVFNAEEEEAWGTNPENADTDGDGVVDEADLVGLGQDEFTWIYRKGDKVSVAVEGMSNIAINEGATERLRYKNVNWDGAEDDLDLSPLDSPETWYKDKRKECQDLRETASNNEYSDCMKKLWEHQLEDKNDEDAFGQMTGYYKIMWAAPGICSGEVKDSYNDDWCDTNDDLGFQYLKLYDPVEKGKQLMEVSINVSPKNPQFKEPEEEAFSDEHSDSTDRIIASANVVGQGSINPDYLYYKWSVWRCDQEDFDKCENVTDELTEDPKFRSRLTGLGLRDIWFYPDDFLIDDDRTLLKIGVIVKKHRNSVMSSPGINGEYTEQIFSNEKKEIGEEDRYVQKYAYSASKLVEITRHTMDIKLYQAKPTDAGGWEIDKEICGENSEINEYRKICPVYQYQVLAAEVSGAGEAISWMLNGRMLGPTLNAENNAEDPNSALIFFPITGVDGELGTIKVISEKENQVGDWEDDNMSEARVFSIHRPMAKIVDKEGVLDRTSIQRAYTDVSGGNVKSRQSHGKQLWWSLYEPAIPFIGDIDQSSTVDIPVVVIPRYLNDKISDRSIFMRTYMNGNIKKSTLNNEGVSVRNDVDVNRVDWLFENIYFIGEKDKINSFKVRTVVNFKKDEYYLPALKASFGIDAPEEIVHDQEIKIKQITPEEYNAITGDNISLSMKEKTGKFFASTIKNSPEYLVFILRLAVSFILVAMMTFGLVYGTRRI